MIKNNLSLNRIANVFYIIRNQILEYDTKKDSFSNEEKKAKRSEIIWKLQQMSESIEQEVISRKLINKYKDAKLLGKNNKKDLVFEVDQTKVRITPNGRVL